MCETDRKRETERVKIRTVTKYICCNICKFINRLMIFCNCSSLYIEILTIIKSSVFRASAVQLKLMDFVTQFPFCYLNMIFRAWQEAILICEYLLDSLVESFPRYCILSLIFSTPKISFLSQFCLSSAGVRAFWPINPFNFMVHAFHIGHLLL